MLAQAKKYASENPISVAYSRKKYDLKRKLKKAEERVIKTKQEIQENLESKPKP